MFDKNLNVLLVDDNAADSKMVMETLESAGFSRANMGRVERLSEGLSERRRRKLDVVLLNLMLPDSSGAHTVLSYRLQDDSTPIIALSEVDSEAMELAAIQSGAQEYLFKGRLDENSLLRSVRSAIQRREVEHSGTHTERRLNRLLTRETEQLEKRCNVLKQRVRKRVSRLVQMREEFQEGIKCRSQLESKLEGMQNEMRRRLQEKADDLTKLWDQLQEESRIRQLFESQVKSLQGELQNREDEHVAQLAAAESRLQETVSEHQKVEEALKQELHTLKDREQQLTARLEKANSRIQEEIANREQAEEMDRKTLAELHQQAHDHAEQVRAIERKRIEEIAERDRAEQALKDELVELTRKAQRESHKQTQDYAEQVKAVERRYIDEITELNRAHKKLKDERDEMALRLQDEAVVFAETKERLGREIDKHAHNVEVWQRAHYDLERRSQKRIESLTAENQRLQEEIVECRQAEERATQARAE